MLNHVRTLLLNESAANVDAWYVDPSFVQINIRGDDMAAFHGLLFYGTNSVMDKERRVSEVMPFALDVEFSDVRSLFDTRVTVASDHADKPVKYSTVFSFYRTLSDESMDTANRCVSSVSTPQLFSWDDENRDQMTEGVRRMQSVYSGSKELCKRFSACLWAYLIRLERIRLEREGQVFS